MEGEVFPVKSVGDFYNKNFINVKLDAEKESSHGFFKNFKARGYPAFFYLDADGNLLDNQGGACSSDVFIARGEKALKSNLGAEQRTLADRWNNGERSYELLNDYVFKVLALNKPGEVQAEVINFAKGLTEEQKRDVRYANLLKSSISLGASRNSRGSRGGEVDKNIGKDYLTQEFLRLFDYLESVESKYDTSIPSLYSKMYVAMVRMNTSNYLRANEEGIKTTDAQIKKIYSRLKRLDVKYYDLYKECIAAERELYTGNYGDGIEMVEGILTKYGKDNPYLYSSLLYSIIISNYHTKGNKIHIDKVVAMAEEALKVNPIKSNVYHYAVALRTKGDYERAFSALSDMRFYKGPELSNSVYRSLNIQGIRKDFTDINVNVK